jgi:pimeloyl-ACP methyl ester carboxylesterase
MSRAILFSFILITAMLYTCKPENHGADTDTKTDSSAVAGTAFESGYSDVNGIKMYYEVYGEGKPLVLIHGGGSTIQTSFARIIPLLSKTRKVIAVELQAHGRTGDRNAPISFEQDAEDVATLLKNINISKADILGFSNGGITTMLLATRYPEVVDRIIVASAFYKRNGMFPGFWDFMKKGTIADMPGALKEAFLKVNPDSAKLQNLFEKCSQRMLTFKDWSDEDLKAIKAKTLIVAGDKDVATLEHYLIMHRLISNSQLMIIPGGHGEFIGEISFPDAGRHSESFALLVEEFLE